MGCLNTNSMLEKVRSIEAKEFGLLIMKKMILIMLLGMVIFLHGCTFPKERYEKRFLDNKNLKDVQTDSRDTSLSVPRYSLLYDEVLRLEKQNKLEEALKIIPGIYECEIPVSAFYSTIEAKKRDLLVSLSERLEDFKMIYLSLIIQPDTLYYYVDIDNELQPERFYYLSIVKEVDISREGVMELIKSYDPWIVSAGLFLARKEKLLIPVHEVLRCWSDVPHLWDETCTEQALLYFAAQEDEDIKGFKIENGDIVIELRKLQDVDTEKNNVQIFAVDNMHSADLSIKYSELEDELKLKRILPEGESELREKFPCVHRPDYKFTLKLPKGMYRANYISGSKGSAVYTVMSEPFSCTEGIFTRVFIVVEYGV